MKPTDNLSWYNRTKRVSFECNGIEYELILVDADTPENGYLLTTCLVRLNPGEVMAYVSGDIEAGELEGLHCRMLLSTAERLLKTLNGASVGMGAFTGFQRPPIWN
jgi:hypothetical protein